MRGLFTLLLLVTGCATLAEKYEHILTLSETEASENNFTKTDFVEQTGTVDYKFGKAGNKAEWLDCKIKSPNATILIMHPDKAGFDKAQFCDGWMAQTFLSQGFDVVAVNRPGYGGSTGSPDFSGQVSMAAIEAAVPAALKTAKNPKPLVGIWGYDTGATAATLAAKRLKGLNFLILGGGVYDYEDALKKSSDSYLKSDIETMKKTGGEKAIEDRSIAYDVSGLPHLIAIYHGKQDTVVPPSQAKGLADSLESSGQYKVNLQIVEGLGHDIPWIHHRKMLEVLAHSVQP